MKRLIVILVLVLVCVATFLSCANKPTINDKTDNRWVEILTDSLLGSSGNIVLDHSGYSEIMLQVKSAAGDGRLIGHVIIPLQTSGAGIPRVFDMSTYGMDGNYYTRAFFVTTTNVNYSITLNPATMYLSVFVR